MLWLLDMPFIWIRVLFSPMYPLDFSLSRLPACLIFPFTALHGRGVALLLPSLVSSAIYASNSIISLQCQRTHILHS